jgi:1,6-anhydro-N-acetylmuramate kinase
MPHLALYKVIGVMSGSSLDGIDIAYCTFIHENDNWQFTIDKAECISYSEDWLKRLRTARELDGRSLWKLHADYGHLLGISSSAKSIWSPLMVIRSFIIRERSLPHK